MTTRRIVFFMRFDEFVPLVWQQAERSGLSIVLVPHGLQSCEIAAQPGTLALRDGSLAWRIYFARNLPHQLPNNNEIRPDEWGWVQSDVPVERDNVLLKIMLAAKSENPDVITLFRGITAAFRKRLTYPVWAYNGREESPQPHRYRDIAYSEGAARWYQSGGELRQSFTDYVRYSIDGSVRDRA